MKILLLNPPLYDLSKYRKGLLLSAAPALSLGYLAAVVKKAGYDVKIIDMLFYDWEKVEEVLHKEKPDIVGITCLTEGRMSAFRLAALVKKVNKKTIVVMGGHHATYMYDQVLSNFQVDFIVLGEGEITFLNLIKTLNKKNNPNSVHGIAYKKGTKIVKTKDRAPIVNLDSLPFPLYEQFDFDAYPKVSTLNPQLIKMNSWNQLKDRKYASIITSRGCPYNCQFCSSTVFWGVKWRFRSAQNVLDEIELLYKKYNIRYFNFADDAFTVDTKRAIEICKGILDRKLDIVWDCTTRANFITEELVIWMKKAGCIMTALGVESGSAKILKNINKKVTIEQVINAFKILHKVGLPAYPLLMVGNPGETEETVEETKKLINIIKPFNVAVSITMVFPGSALYNLAKQQKFINDDFWLSDKPQPYYTLEWPIEKLEEWRDKLTYSILSSNNEKIKWSLSRIGRNIKYSFIAPVFTIPIFQKFINSFRIFLK